LTWFASDEAHDQHGEDESEGFGAEVVAVHEDDGRAGDEGEEAGEGEGSGERVGDELRLAEDRPEALHDGLRAERDGAVGCVAFGQQGEGQRQNQRRVGGEKKKYPSPAQSRYEQAADCGSKQRRGSDDKEEQGKDFGAFARVEEVAHHGDGGDLRGAASDGLDEAERDEGVDAAAPALIQWTR